MGTNKDGITKIRNDYKKRKSDDGIEEFINYTYVAVTSAILDSSKKQLFCEKAKKEGIFKNVIVLDANDLEEWLEEHIDVALWLLKEFGRSIDEYDIGLVEDEWKNISDATEPKLSYEIFTVGNEAISTKFVDDIKNQTTNKIYVVSSQYYGKELAYDFTLASLFLVNNQTIIDQCICVKSQAALNTIDAFCEDKIVLVNFNCLDFRFTKSLRNTYIFFDTYFTTDIALKIPYRQDFVKQVEKLGFDSINASRISFLIDYNVLALKRLLAKMLLMKIPQWARKKEKSELVPLLLMGEIRMDNEGDIEILRELVGDSYDNYLDILNFWGETNESPIFKYENI